MENKLNLVPLLNYIDPCCLDYQEWINVGMALKEEGYSVDIWDSWSQRDASRYHSHECARKWQSFRNDTSHPVTGGTIVAMAQDNGWKPEGFKDDHELAWDDIIGSKKDEMVLVDKNWIEGREIAEPATWDPVKQLVTYLETLFESTENVGYCTTSWEKDGRYLPTKGNYDRTAGELISALNKCKGDIASILGDYKEECGAWIRFNPLDGKGVKNENVTEFRYALVESDNMEIEKQNEIIRTLELPVACLVYSGKKSLHAIVKIDAANYDEYRKRVDYLYAVCRKNGLEIDTQNRNPSRLSRMPGVTRNGHKQYLIDTNIGKGSFTEWQEWIEAVNDDLPDPESLSDAWDNLPPLADPLINGILRKGHKMLLAGPSKAGKSFALIELCCAIAEGQKWLNFSCAQGKVMYVNLELDKASCLHRFRDVYEAQGLAPNNLSNIEIWNLRGKSVPMDKLAPKLIRRAAKKDYVAIVIDPIYKVITGDENSADQMAHFCNQFDKVCTELGCAVIYCHHHSKGGQGNKRSMDRASGSGVFARDPDALLDLIELEVTEDLLKQEENKAVCRACVDYLAIKRPDFEDDISQDDMCSESQMLAYCRKVLSQGDYYDLVAHYITPARERVNGRTAWRIEGTLREFPKFAPINLWFDYPVHYTDAGGLKDVEPEGAKAPWEKATQRRKEQAKASANNKKLELENAIGLCNFGEPPTKKQLAEYLNCTERSVADRLKNHGGFMIDKNHGDIIVKKIATENTIN
ncbi:MAG: AAA family ATPase [Acidaminococcaceae bacterium]